SSLRRSMSRIRGSEGRELRRAMASSLLAEHAGAQVTVAPVTGNAHNNRILDLLRQLQCRKRSTAGGNTAADAFLARQCLHRALGVFLANVHDAVHPAALEYARQVGLGPAPDAGDARTFRR